MFVVEGRENFNGDEIRSGGACPVENCLAAGCFAAAAHPGTQRATCEPWTECSQDHCGGQKLVGTSLVLAALSALVVPLGTMVAVVVLLADVTGELLALGWALLAASISVVPGWWWLRHQGRGPRHSSSAAGMVDKRT